MANATNSSVDLQIVSDDLDDPDLSNVTLNSTATPATSTTLDPYGGSIKDMWAYQAADNIWKVSYIIDIQDMSI